MDGSYSCHSRTNLAILHVSNVTSVCDGVLLTVTGLAANSWFCSHTKREVCSASTRLHSGKKKQGIVSRGTSNHLLSNRKAASQPVAKPPRLALPSTPLFATHTQSLSTTRARALSLSLSLSLSFSLPFRNSLTHHNGDRENSCCGPHQTTSERRCRARKSHHRRAEQYACSLATRCVRVCVCV
jgi:hypothetical protein